MNYNELSEEMKEALEAENSRVLSFHSSINNLGLDHFIAGALSETAERIHTQGTLDIADIRNKLGPLVTLINIIEGDHVKLDTSNEIIEILVSVLEQSKISINYLSQREAIPLPEPSGKTLEEFVKCTCKNGLEYENCAKNCGHGQEPKPQGYISLEETDLEYIADSFGECYVTKCCKRGPITEDENYCAYCGKKIKRS